MSVEVQQGELDTDVRVLVTSSSGTAQGTYNSLTSVVRTLPVDTLILHPWAYAH